MPAPLQNKIDKLIPSGPPPKQSNVVGPNSTVPSLETLLRKDTPTMGSTGKAALRILYFFMLV